MNQQQEYVSEATIAERAEISRRTVKRWRHDPSFPAPIVLAPRVLRWRWEEVADWFDSRPRSSLDEPEQLRVARSTREDARELVKAPLNVQKDEPEQKRIGRQRRPPAEVAQPRTVRLTDAEWSKLQAQGGAQLLRSLLKRL